MSLSVFLIWDGEYEQRAVTAAYSDRADAEAHVAKLGGEVEELEVRGELPEIRPYYHATGQVGRRDANVDIVPTVERRGLTVGLLGDGEGVATCPGSEWMLGSRQTEPSIWLSAFGMGSGETLSRCQNKFEDLRRRRRRDGELPAWSDLT